MQDLHTIKIIICRLPAPKLGNILLLIGFSLIKYDIYIPLIGLGFNHFCVSFLFQNQNCLHRTPGTLRQDKQMLEQQNY